MLNYVLSKSAKADLKNIYRFGYDRFGEQQADRYYDGLIACFREIAKNPLQFPLVPEVGTGYPSLCLHFRKHLLPRNQ